MSKPTFSLSWREYGWKSITYIKMFYNTGAENLKGCLDFVEQTDHVHMFWGCPYISIYWVRVYGYNTYNMYILRPRFFYIKTRKLTTKKKLK